jgi:hypothetical protein
VTFIEDPDVLDVLTLVEEYGTAREAVQWSAARNDDAEMCARQRYANRLWSHVEVLLGRPVVSLVRGFIPTDRMPCGCLPEGSENPLAPFRWQHDSRSHEDRARYEWQELGAEVRARRAAASIRGAGEVARVGRETPGGPR